MPRTRAPHLKASMTGAQFQALRVRLGLEVRDLARLLACSETTIRMIEAPNAPNRPSRQLEQMMRWLSNPVIRGEVETMDRGG